MKTEGPGPELPLLWEGLQVLADFGKFLGGERGVSLA